MKSMSENYGGNNWLGFSLSPHMKMESAVTSAPVSPSTVPTSYVLSSSPSPHHHGLCSYGGESISIGSNGEGFQYAAAATPLSMMPLKSDGSLCIMEALSRSHPQVFLQGILPSPAPPKLEDFLTIGGAHHHHHHPSYGGERDAMPLSLDTIYYPTMGDLGGDGLCLRNWVGSGREYEHSIDSSGAASTVIGCGGELQSLSLSMSPGSQSSCVTTAPSAQQISASIEVVAAANVDNAKKRALGKVGQKQTVHRKSIDTFGQRTSQYRGVTRHRWTGRYEAHLWDNSCKKEGQTRKGRQVYLGGYDMEEKAARAYDLAALKYWGPSTHINFPLENYQQELEGMKNMSRQEYVAHLRRKSSGFSRGASIYRGVTRHHQHGRWQARIGRVAGNKDLYLGTFSTQEEAAEAYDIAAIKFRGVNAVTNFDITRYDVERIMASNTLLAGELARRTKGIEPINIEATAGHGYGIEGIQRESNNNGTGSDWKMVLHNSPQQTYSTAIQGFVGMESVNPKCGSTNKVHFIFKHKNPKSGEYVEHHLKYPSSVPSDKLSHVYTAILKPDNELRILIDGEEKKKANFLSSEDFEPPLIPAKTIPDPDDKKPEDWDEQAKIPDPDAVKPDDWDEDAPMEIEDEEAVKPEGWLDDEPEEIDDPDATKPEDWDDEEDGEWEAPKIDNPKCEIAPGCGEWKRPMKRNPAYKGKWHAPLIDNPNYKGIWKPRDIPNPEYFELDKPDFEPIAAIGIEIWTMQDGILFDNILISSDEKVAESYRETAWKPKFEVEKEKQKAEEAAAGSDGLSNFQKKVFDFLYKVADIPFLEAYKPKILDLIEKAEKQPNITIGALVSVAVIILTVLFRILFSGKKPKVNVPEARTEPAAETSDNQGTSEEQEREEEKEEDEDEEEKEEDAAAAAAPRRRSRRET